MTCGICERLDTLSRLYICPDCREMPQADLKIAIELLKNKQNELEKEEDYVRDAQPRY